MILEERSLPISRYRLQYQPRYTPGNPVPRETPLTGNDKWATAADNLTPSQAIGKLNATGALPTIRRTDRIKTTTAPVMDDRYFYRLVPCDLFAREAREMETC